MTVEFDAVIELACVPCLVGGVFDVDTRRSCDAPIGVDL